MGIFSKAETKDELILVFNIGSTSVGGALFWAQKSGIPKIIFSVREPIKVEEEVNIGKFLSQTIKSLETVVKKVHMSNLGAPSRIFCILSSLWYVSQTRTISLKKNTPFIFTEKLADELIQKEIKLFQDEHFEQYTNVSSTVRPIELKNIKTLLNGYETVKPLDQKINELEMVLFVSMSGEQVLQKIEKTIGRYFNLIHIKFSSAAVASFIVIRDLFPARENFLLIDIGGEITDISMIKKGILGESISFPLGRNFLTRGVASGLNCSLSEAASLISLYKDGHADKSTSEKLLPIINQLKNEWLKSFQNSLANLSHDISIPATIYIAIGKDIADFFSETIKNEQFNQYTLTESKFEVIFLDVGLFHGLALFEESAMRDSFLIIDAIYSNRSLIK